jgi:hypothetical protein
MSFFPSPKPPSTIAKMKLTYPSVDEFMKKVAAALRDEPYYMDKADADRMVSGHVAYYQGILDGAKSRGGPSADYLIDRAAEDVATGVRLQAGVYARMKANRDAAKQRA